MEKKKSLRFEMEKNIHRHRHIGSAQPVPKICIPCMKLTHSHRLTSLQKVNYMH